MCSCVQRDVHNSTRWLFCFAHSISSALSLSILHIRRECKSYTVYLNVGRNRLYTEKWAAESSGMAKAQIDCIYCYSKSYFYALAFSFLFIYCMWDEVVERFEHILKRQPTPSSFLAILPANTVHRNLQLYRSHFMPISSSHSAIWVRVHCTLPWFVQNVQTCLSADISIYPNVHMFLDFVSAYWNILFELNFFPLPSVCIHRIDITHFYTLQPCRGLSKQINTCSSNEIWLWATSCFCCH